MTFPPWLCIRFQSGILLVFLTSLLLAQLGRADEQKRSARSAQRGFYWTAAAFIIAAGIFIPPLFSESPLLGAELAAGFTLALLHPVNALCFFIHLLFLRPWEVLPENTLLALLPRLLAGTCLLSWILHPAGRRLPEGIPYRPLMIFLGFSLWLLLSTFVAPDVGAAQSEWFGTFFKILVVFTMCLIFVQDRHGVSELTQTIIISIFGMASMALFEFYYSAPAGGQFSRRLRSNFSILDPNDLAALTVMALPLALAPFLRGEGALIRRLTGILLGGVALATIWYSQSRGALIALFSEILGAFTLQNIRRRWAGALFLLGLLSIGYFGILKSSTRTQEDLGASAESRGIYWKAAVKMTFRNALLGVGFGGYPRNYETYSSGARHEWGNRTAHSSWLLAFAESGLIGGFLFLSFFIAVGRTAWRNRRKRPEHLYAFLGYGVAMSFLSHTYLLYPYLICALILASDIAESPRHAL